jgi:hypothetical protein
MIIQNVDPSVARPERKTETTHCECTRPTNLISLPAQCTRDQSGAAPFVSTFVIRAAPSQPAFSYNHRRFTDRWPLTPGFRTP